MLFMFSWRSILFLLMRKVSDAAGFYLLSGTFYMLNPQFVSLIYGEHDGKMYVIALLPFVVWRLKALMERPGMRNHRLWGWELG